MRWSWKGLKRALHPSLLIPPPSLLWPGPQVFAATALAVDQGAPSPAARAIIITPHIDAPQDLSAMELTIQTLALAGPARTRAIALELVGWDTHRALIIRAARTEALDYLALQIRARYPQSTVKPLAMADDPWRIAGDEVVRARELRPTGAPFVSLRTWSPKPSGPHEHQVGVDPLLGVLATLGPFPPGMRVITQLALAPASATWSTGQPRAADQYSLARARQEDYQRDRVQPSSGSFAPILIGFLVLVGIWWLMLPSTHATRLPLIGPLIASITQALHQGHTTGSSPSVVLGHLLPTVIPALLVIIGLVFAGAAFFGRLSGRTQRFRPVYDPDEVRIKTSQPGYHARLRLYAIGPRHANRREQAFLLSQALERVVAAYRQFHSAGANVFVERTIPAFWADALTPEAPFWAGDHPRRRNWWTWGVTRSPYIVSLAEAATLWHLPQPYDLPELPWLEHMTTAKTLLAPHAVIVPDDASLEVLTVGQSRHAGHAAKVTLAWETIRQHSLALAKTGKGKSSLLLLLARLALLADDPQRAGQGRDPHYPGIILVDPHGDLAGKLLSIIPPERHAEVVVFDLADTAHPCAFNPLDILLGRDRDKAVENLLAVFADIWDKGWGYRMANAMSFALKTLYAANYVKVHVEHDDPHTQYTLLDVAPLLTNRTFREWLLKKYLPKDQIINEWWHDYFDKLYDRLRLDVINPVLTKVAQFSNSLIARRIVGQSQTTLNLTEIVRDGKILIINTARGVVGAETSRLIAATLLGALRITLEEQANVALEERRRLLVLVDEFQTLQGVDFGSMLAELRKFGASFVLATQALAYLDRNNPDLRATVLANTDNLFCFAMSADDARLMERELDGVITGRDLINLPNYTCYVKLTVAGTRLPVFTLTLDQPPKGDPERARTLREASRDAIAPFTPEQIDDHIAQLAALRPTLKEEEPTQPSSQAIGNGKQPKQGKPKPSAGKPGKTGTADPASDTNREGFLDQHTTGAGIPNEQPGTFAAHMGGKDSGRPGRRDRGGSHHQPSSPAGKGG